MPWDAALASFGAMTDASVSGGGWRTSTRSQLEIDRCAGCGHTMSMRSVGSAPAEGAAASTQSASATSGLIPERPAWYRVGMEPSWMRSALVAALVWGLAGAARGAVPPADEWLPEARALVEAFAPRGRFNELVTKGRGKWVDPAARWLPGVVPAGASPRVVYPFGGGDLMGALVTFPRASEVTTLSLEPAGDVRVLALARGDAAESLMARFRPAFDWLLRNAHSKTVTMGSLSGRDVPGQLMYWVAGLAVLDYEAVSLKYFRIDERGGIAYVRRDALAPGWSDNAELTVRRRGQPGAPLIVYRHVRANLDDAHLAKRAGLMRHLESKGRISAMTKAASYLLWSAEFSRIRDYLLEHADWMVSDSTGIPPRIAGPAGFEQITYGAFSGPCIGAGHEDVLAFRALWAGQAKRELPFRYGYPDAKRQNHLLITRRRK